MAHKRLGPASLAKMAGPGNPLSQMERSTEFSASLSFRQDLIDPAVILAARANVALSTARVHAELFGIGGAYG